MATVNKKQLAIVFAADNRHSFALATALLSLKENSPKLFAGADIIVFTKDISEENQKVLNSLVPVTFKNFNVPFNPANLQMLQRYTCLCMARYECFNMLNEYKNVISFDIDLLFKKECENILKLNKTGIAMAHDDNIVASNFCGEVKGFNFKKQNYNTGVFALNDSLPGYKDLASWCFIQTQSLAPKILWIDQSIINIALQNFKFKASTLPRTYNVHPLLSPVKTGDAYILHTMGVNKFWNNLPSFAWRRYYKQWLAAGGTPMQPQNKRLTVRMLYLLKLTVENIPWLWDVIKVMIRNRFKKLNEEAINRG